MGVLARLRVALMSLVRPQLPPVAFEALGWLGAYLHDGTRLVQVLGVQPEYLQCEDAVDGSRVYVRLGDVGEGATWRVVVAEDEAS